MFELTGNQEFGSDEEPSHGVDGAVCPLGVDSVVDTESVVCEVTAHGSNGEKRSQVVQLSLPRLHESDIIVLGNFANDVVSIGVDLAKGAGGRESVVKSRLGLRGRASDCRSILIHVVW